ncbi:MAG: viroplasmin family protein [Bacteroidales bacterium]
MIRTKKYYVVWSGHNPGVYESWDECKQQIAEYKGAKYKSFPNKEEAVMAFRSGFDKYLSKAPTKQKVTIDSLSGPAYELEAIAVDASCMGNPGIMEYRGVYVRSGHEIFRIGPFKDGTNNIGEFLALVHGLALLKQKQSNMPIYTDSLNAMKWVKNKKCKTTLEHTPNNAEIFDLISRAEKWLQNNTYNNPILKWETHIWGEIPADFGRK